VYLVLWYEKNYEMDVVKLFLIESYMKIN